MDAFVEVASGLRFPEGPVAMPDGSILVCEMFGECVTRVRVDGGTERVADVPGGPNGAAIGPDGALYLCNNGGSFSEMEVLGLMPWSVNHMPPCRSKTRSLGLRSGRPSHSTYRSSSRPDARSRRWIRPPR